MNKYYLPVKSEHGSMLGYIEVIAKDVLDAKHTVLSGRVTDADLSELVAGDFYDEKTWKELKRTEWWACVNPIDTMISNEAEEIDEIKEMCKELQNSLRKTVEYIAEKLVDVDVFEVLEINRELIDFDVCDAGNFQKIIRNSIDMDEGDVIVSLPNNSQL